MDIQKEKIAHEKHLLSQGVDLKHLPNIKYNELENVYELIEWDEEYSEALNEINSSWCTWQAAKAQAVQGWISVEDGLPPCDFEFCETGECVSNVVLIHSAATYGFNMGMGHVNEDGVWNVYSGEHDFMNVLEVTHWMPLPDAPQEPIND